MALSDQIVSRVYKCDNPDCAAEIAYEQKVSDPWKKKCPFCKKMKLYIDSGSMNISLTINLNNPRTLGLVAEKNRERAEKEGKIFGRKKPFWRKKDKIDFSILKNPKKYVETGTI